MIMTDTGDVILTNVKVVVSESLITADASKLFKVPHYNVNLTPPAPKGRMAMNTLDDTLFISDGTQWERVHPGVRRFSTGLTSIAIDTSVGTLAPPTRQTLSFDTPSSTSTIAIETAGVYLIGYNIVFFALNVVFDVDIVRAWILRTALAGGMNSHAVDVSHVELGTAPPVFTLSGAEMVELQPGDTLSLRIETTAAEIVVLSAISSGDISTSLAATLVV